MTDFASMSVPSGWLQLNVGGKTLATNFETLASVKGSLLEEMANKGHQDCVQDAAGVVHIDYDAKLFEVILHFLRTGRLIRRGHSLEELLQEAKHWRLPTLEAFCSNALAHEQRTAGALLPSGDTGQGEEQPQTHGHHPLEWHDASEINADSQASNGSAWDTTAGGAPQTIAQVGHNDSAASEMPQVTSAQMPADESREALVQHTSSGKQPSKEKESVVPESISTQPEPAVADVPEHSAVRRPPRVRVFRYPTIVNNKVPDAAVQSHAPGAQASADESREVAVQQAGLNKQPSEKEKPALTELNAHLPGQQQSAVDDDPDNRASTRPPRVRVFRYPTIVNNKSPVVTVQSHTPDTRELQLENGTAKPQHAWDTKPEDWDGVWNATQQNTVAVDQGADIVWNSGIKQEPAVPAPFSRRSLAPGMRGLIEVAASLSRGQSSGNFPATSAQSSEPPSSSPVVVNGEKQFAVLNQLNALSNGKTKTSSSSVEPTAASDCSGRVADAQQLRSSSSRRRYARGGGFGGTPRCTVVVPPAGPVPWGQPHRPQAQLHRTPYESRSTPKLRREEEW